MANYHDDINSGLAMILKSIFELLALCFVRRRDARTAVQQDIEANQFSWDDKPRRRWTK